MTSDGLTALLDAAETVGLPVLAADIVRTPVDDDAPGVLGPRAALAEALAAWWAALLSVGPGPDGAPKGLFVRAWANDAARGDLHAALRANETSGGGGLAGLACGVAAAVAVLGDDDGHHATLDEVQEGLAVLTGARQPFAHQPWASAARARIDHATSWWPERIRARCEAVWRESLPEPPAFLDSLHRWWTLERGATLGAEDPGEWAVVRRLARVRRRHPDPIATFQPATRGTTCCPTLPTHTGFPDEVARGWPHVAECPNCARLIAPPEVHDLGMRRVALWLEAETTRASTNGLHDIKGAGITTLEHEIELPNARDRVEVK